MSITSTASASDATVGVGFSTNSTTNNLAYITTSSNTSSTTASFTDNTAYSAGAITNLNTSANGSRRFYRYAPPSSLASPTSLNFTSVTATGMTLNWTASSPTTNVVKYAIYNSTDNSTFTYVSTVALGTNTYAATGLNAGTTYYWKVYPLSEGVLGTALSGTQATSAYATYYWTGVTGGTFATLSNWNTQANGGGSAPAALATTDIYIIDGASTVAGAAVTINLAASQTVGQLKITSNTACILQSSATTQRVITISGNSS
jgi:hypothetical protein